MTVDVRTDRPASTGHALEVLLLGTTEVRRDGVAAAAGGPLQRATLAILALAGGETVSTEQLMVGLWGDDPPPSAAGTLRAYLSRLRTGVAAGALQPAPGGHRLDPRATTCDAGQFGRALADDGDDPEALGAALALWRGSPLADLRHLPFAATHVVRLEALRHAALTRRAELLLAHHRHAEAVTELASAVDAAPHDERLAGLLARALAGSGRHGDALATLDRLRRRLRDDLGLDLGPELQDLQTAVLVHDPDVLGAGTVAATAPSVPPPGNVPLPLTSFVGRSVELARLAELTASARIVTLTGPGGCGKTRLALEATRRLQATAGREAWVVELAELDATHHVATAVARTLGVATTAATTFEAVASALGGRRLLLVLDNCEHVVTDAARLVEGLLARCHGLQVLATSREPLDLPGEHLLPVAPLPVGTAANRGDAEALLLDRLVAHGVDVGDPAAAPLVHRLCEALDGIPLALELAAARCKVLSLADVADRLDDRFALLEGGGRTAAARHRTLAAAIAWSHDLLEDDERQLLGSASVLRGSFDLEDLAAVHDTSSSALLGPLGALVDKSMVTADNRVTGTRRYRLLETIRVFAHAQLDDDTRRRLADAHLHHFTTRAETASARLRTFDDAPAWRWIEASRADLDAAFDHAISTASPCAPRLVAALGWFAYRRGVVREGLRWCQLVRPLRDHAGPDVATAVVVAEAALTYVAGEHERLPALIDELLTGAAAAHDPTVRALAEIYLAYFEAAFGDPTRAEPHVQAALSLAAAGAAPWVAAEVAMPRGQLLRALGRPAEAIPVLQEGQAAGAACGHRWAVGSLAWIEAKARLDLRDPVGAATLLVGAVTSFARQGDRTSTLAGLHTAAAAAAMLERHELGARLLGAVDALGARIGFDAAAMDPADAEAHRALVRFGCTEREWHAWRAVGAAMTFEAALDAAQQLTAGA